MPKENKIPDIIIQGIEKSIEISRKCVSEEGKISPKVGAVLIKDNIILETAYRGEIKEGDHAEYTLLEKKLKSIDFSDTILITTLEPCTIRGADKTSCAERIVNAGIKHVWIGINDPNPAISTHGDTYLRMKKVSIDTFPDEYAQEVLRLNEEFFKNETNKYKHDVMLTPDLPKVEMKTFFSIDKIINLFNQYLNESIDIDDYIWCLGEKLPYINDYSLFNFSLEHQEERETTYNFPYNLIYRDYSTKSKFNMEKFLSELDDRDERILFVKGPSGIGKSQFLKFLNCQLSIDFREKKYSKIPILIDLNYWELRKTVYDLCKEQILLKTSISEEIFRSLIKENRFIILMDAINELNVESILSFKKDLMHMMEIYPQIKIIISMTSNTDFELPLKKNDPLTLWMSPINLNNLKSYYDTQNLPIDFNEFLKQIKENNLSKLVKILLFFNYIIIYLKKKQIIPDTRYEIIDTLINQYFNEFLKQKFKTIELEKSIKIWQQLLISLSYHMHVKLQSTKIKTSLLRAFFSEAINLLKYQYKIPEEVKVDNLIDFFISFNILKFEGENTKFFHDLLFEYHCGLKLAEKINQSNKIFKKKFFHTKILKEPINIAFPLIKNEKFHDKCKNFNSFMYINGILQKNELSIYELEFVTKFLEKKINSVYFYIQKLAVSLIIKMIKFLEKKEDFLINLIENENLKRHHGELILELGKLKSEEAKIYLTSLKGNAEIHRYRVLALCNFNDESLQEIILNDLKETWHGNDYLKWVSEGLLILMKNQSLTENSINEVVGLFLKPPKKLKFNFKNYTHYENEFSISSSYRNGLMKFLIQQNNPKIIPELFKIIDYKKFDHFPIIKVISNICTESDFTRFLKVIKNDELNYDERELMVEIVKNSTYNIDLNYILNIIQKIPNEFSDKNEDTFYEGLIELFLQRERILNYNEEIIFNCLSTILDRIGWTQKAIIKVIREINPEYLFENNPIKTINYYAFEELIDVIKENKYIHLKQWLIHHAKDCIPNWNKGANKAFHNWFLFFKILEVLLEIDAYEESRSLFEDILDNIDNWEHINHVSFQIIEKFENSDKMQFIKKIYNGYIQLTNDKYNHNPSMFIESIQPFDSEEFITFNINILKDSAKSDYLLAESAIHNLISLDIKNKAGEIFNIYKKGVQKQLIYSMLRLLSVLSPDKSFKILKSHLKNYDHSIRNTAFEEIRNQYETQNLLWYNGEEIP